MSGCAWEGFFTSSQRKRWLSAIPQRYSCRKFSGPADVAQLSALHYLAARAQLPGLRLAFGECDSTRLFVAVPLVPRIEYASQYVALMVNQGHPDALLHAGIAGEALCLEATQQNLGSCWVSGTLRRRQVEIELGPDERIAAVIPFGQAAPVDKATSSPRKALAALCLDDPASWPLWAYQAAEAVRMAPSAVNRQPWRFGFSGGTLMLSGRGFGSLDYGIAILHMDCALQPYSPSYRFASDGKSLLVNIKEAHEPV